MDIPECGAAEPYSCRNIAQTALHQDNVRRIYRNIRACTDRNADIGARQRRRIIYSIPDHCYLAALHESAYLSLFPVRQNTRYDLIDSGLRAYCLCRALIVSGKHHDLYAHVLELAYSLRAVLFYDVRNCDYAEELVPRREKQRRLAGFRKLFGLGSHFIRHFCPASDEIKVSAAESHTVKHSRKAVAGQSLELRYVSGGNAGFAAVLQHCAGKRMFTLLLKRKGAAEKRGLIPSVCRNYIRDLRLAGSDGSGLVQRDDLYPSGLFKRGRGLEQYSVFRSESAADHNCNRRRKPQRARAAYHQHRYTARKRIAEALPDEKPYGGRHQRYAYYCRHEHAGNLVRYLCNRRFCGRGIADHLDYL